MIGTVMSAPADAGLNLDDKCANENPQNKI
jgi:hypothetical protein